MNNPTEATVVTITVVAESEHESGYLFDETTVAGVFQSESDAQEFAEMLHSAVYAFIRLTDCTTLVRISKDVALWLLKEEQYGDEWILMDDVDGAPEVTVSTQLHKREITPNKYKDFFGSTPFPDEESA